MKTSFTTFFLMLLFILFSAPDGKAQVPQNAPTGWSIVASYTIPGKASGLAWDGTYIYFGIYGSNGSNGSNIHKFNPATGTSVLQCTGAFEDAYGLTCNIYSNPSDGNFSVKITCREYLHADMRITDMRGTIVYEWQGLYLEPGDHLAELNLANRLVSGVYLLEIITEAGNHRDKLVIQK